MALLIARRLRPGLTESAVLTVAAGGMAGESIAGVIVALLTAIGALCARSERRVNGRLRRPVRAPTCRLLIAEHHGCPGVNSDCPTHTANYLETHLSPIKKSLA